MSDKEEGPTPYDAVVVGDLAVDEIVQRGQTVQAVGGSVYYGAIAMARLGMRVAVVTRLAARDFPRLEELRAAGIRVFAREASQSSGIRNVYLTDDMDRRLCTPLGFAGAFALEEIPDLDTPLYLVGPLMAGAVDLALVRALAARTQVALDVQGFVRVREGANLVLRDWPEKHLGLPLVAVLKADQAEGEVLTGQSDPQAAAAALARLGAREVVLTHSSGVTVWAAGAGYWAPFAPRSLAGRTGRGDTCLAAYLARRRAAPPDESCRFAAGVTSLKLEQPGPFAADLAQVQRLYRELPVRPLSL